MKTKLFILLMANLVIIGLFVYFEPSVQSNVALEQFESGSNAATRSIEYWKNFFWFILPIINLLLVVWILWNPIKNYVNKTSPKKELNGKA